MVSILEGNDGNEPVMRLTFSRKKDLGERKLNLTSLRLEH